MRRELFIIIKLIVIFMVIVIYGHIKYIKDNNGIIDSTTFSINKNNRVR